MSPSQQPRGIHAEGRNATRVTGDYPSPEPPVLGKETVLSAPNPLPSGRGGLAGGLHRRATAGAVRCNVGTCLLPALENACMATAAVCRFSLVMFFTVRAGAEPGRFINIRNEGASAASRRYLG